MKIVQDIIAELGKLREDKKTLRQFAFTIAGALTIIGVLVFFLGSLPERAFWLWGVGAVILILGLTAPKILRPFHKFWMGLAFVLGWFVSRIVLSIVFFLVMTPIAAIMKLRGKDMLEQKIDKDAPSYWLKRDATSRPLERYEKLF